MGRDWRLTIASALVYVLAYNLTFFTQELFLVLPKALTPGLRPTLFHNNHTWDGEHPLERLFQGTGALATIISGLICMVLLGRRTTGSAVIRLFLAWMAFNGFFQALTQVVIGAVVPQNDVGMAMDYLRLGDMAKLRAAGSALMLMPLIGFLLARRLLELAESGSQIATASARMRFIFRIATLPALIAIPLIVPFRIPRELGEVVLPPALSTLIGIAWLQVSAQFVTSARLKGVTTTPSIATLTAATLALLLVFQVILRPGIPFF